MSRYRFDAGIAAARKDARVVRESIVKHAKAPASSGSVVRKLIYSEVGSDAPMLASDAFQSVSKTSLIPESS